MLNLKELEESLDRALELETTESVLAWFHKRNQDKVKDYIGAKGYLSNLLSVRDRNSISEVPSNKQPDLNIPSVTDFGIAA